MALLFRVEGLSKSFGARPLFLGISLSMEDGERTGLIGPNGSGKSTFLKILADVEHADDGELTKRRQLRLGYLPQEDRFPEGFTVEEAMVDALKDDHDDEHDKTTRIAIQLSKVGFTDFDQKVATLSGGWRKRLALARELVQEPELLLLDEPTNHLDLEGILWLEKLLLNAPFAFLLCSHDRYFLENVTNRVIELNRAYKDGFLSINGTYSEFIEKRAEYLANQQSEQQSLAGRVRREIEWLHRGAKARTTKAKGRIQQAGQMMSDLADLKTRNAQTGPVAIDFAATNRQTRKLLTAEKIGKSLGGRELFHDVSFVLGPGTKLGLLGPNGSGKSTLIKLLMGKLEPDSGSIKKADGLRVVVFDQARQQLDKSMTLRNALSPGGDNLVYRGNSLHVSGFAKMFLFRTEQLDLPIGSLSGGEQARILIARLMQHPADLLILDEPTNDLDIPSLEVLEDSLEEFPGAVVLVTHDRFMLDRLATEIVALDGKGEAGLFVDYSQWQRAQEEKEAAPALAKKAAKEAAKASAKPAGLKRLSYMEQREWEQMEAKIMAAEEELSLAQQRLEDPTIMADRNRMHDACEKVHHAQEAVKKLYARWEQLEAKQK